MSKKIDTSLRDPPCEEPPRNGLPLMIGRHGQTSATTQVTGSGISSGAIGPEHLSFALRAVIFGSSGRDGEANFDGTSVVLGLTPVSSVYTLTKDIDCTRIQIQDNVTVKPSGYRLFCNDLHLWLRAYITRDGGVGDTATGSSGGVAGGTGGVDTNQLGGSASGTNGVNGGTAPNGAGVAGGSGGSTSGWRSLGGAGGQGAAGQASGGGGGAGAAAGTVPSVSDVSTVSLDNLTRLERKGSGTFDHIYGGSGGGSGGGGGANAGTNGGGSGASGAGGGALLVVADEIVLHGWTGRISANGGNGGDGDDTAASSGGGGGGGGGGFVQIVCRKVTGGTLIPGPTARAVNFAGRLFSGNSSYVAAANVQANGGNGGDSPAGAAYQGYCGDGGTVTIVNFSDPFIPYSEIPRASQIQPTSRPPRLHAGHYAAMARRAPTE